MIQTNDSAFHVLADDKTRHADLRTDVFVKLRTIRLNLDILVNDVTHNARPEDWPAYVTTLARQVASLIDIVEKLP